MNKETNISTSIKKFSTDDFDAVVITKSHLKKYYLSANSKTYDTRCDIFNRLASYIQNENAQIILQDFFGSCALYGDCILAIEKAFGKVNWPVTWIEGNGTKKQKMTGTQLLAVSGLPVVTPIRIADRIVGSYYESDEGQICYLGGLLPDDVTHSKMEQAATVFQRIEDALKLAGMDLSHLIRTWLYIDKILDWYDDFNIVRTNFFNQKKVFEGLLPASTGIGVSNPASAALVAAALAIKPLSGDVQISKVLSPLQCSATDYKSSFSRAVEIKFSDYRRLYISGTASIDEDGNTIHIGDVKKQIARTMEVVGAILESRHMSWKDVSRAIAYFPDLANSYLLKEYCTNKLIPDMPIAIAHGDICRDDLLFEIEVDAAKTDT